MRALTLAAAAAVLLGACASVDSSGDPAPAAGDTCKAAPGQAFIGRQASAELGGELLNATNSRELRWVPPGTIVTMDYKFGRVTVSYDQAMAITTISCG